MIQLRRLEEGDLPRLVPVLAEAFGHYRDALRYTDDVLDLFESSWWDPPSGVVAEDHGELVGVLAAGERPAVIEGRRLMVLHAGPVAVKPTHWHRGIGSQMMRALEASAEVDVLTLTVNLVEDVGGFYLRLGFLVVEIYQPWVHELACTERAAPHLEGPALRALAPAMADRDEPRVRTFRSGEALLRTVAWPVTTRRGGTRQELSTCQVVDRQGHGPGLDEACAALVKSAHADGARLIWGRPQRIAGLPGFRISLGPGVARMGKALTTEGTAALDRARSWLPAGPSP